MKNFFSPAHFKNQTLNIPNVMIQTRSAFLKFTPQVIESIAKAVHDGDINNVRALLHKLKAAVGAFSPTLRSDVVGLESVSELDDQYRLHINKLINDVSDLMIEVKEFPI